MITVLVAIMMAVFVAFAGADIATVSQLGTGLAVAVLLDATVVRIVLLLALMLLLGDRVWWLPRPLEKILAEYRSSRLSRGLVRIQGIGTRGVPIPGLRTGDRLGPLCRHRR